MSTLLKVSNLAGGYQGQPIVRDLNFEVKTGQVVALLGPNGAGKTTSLLTIAGELSPLDGVVEIFGSKTTAPIHRRALSGLSFVTEERSVFMELSVEENLRVGRCDAGDVLALFPELEPMMKRRAGLLSGGEQQMLTLGRALARKPRLLLIDELSLGLAPLVVGRLLSAVRAAADEGLGVLLVEQHVDRAVAIADYAMVLQRGKLVLAGPRDEVAEQVHQIELSYLGSAPAS
jgi:branched-chain amino acid transport system ATP-binding protein